MNQNDHSALSYYVKVSDLNAEHGISLVRHIGNRTLYVRKILDIYNKPIYDFLQSHNIPGIPQIALISEENGVLTVIEEYISGHTLAELPDDLSEDFIKNIITRLCNILNVLHSQNPPVVHRDIKPSNVMISDRNEVFLLDFNAAKYYDSEAERDTILLGTQGYAAPEQYGFAPSMPQTDIYALGMLIKNMNEALAEPSESLNSIVSKCTQMDPAARYENVRQLLSDLNDAEPVKPISQKGTQVRSSSAHKNIPFLPPGFRTLTPWHMIMAGFFYIFIVFFASTLTIKDAGPAKTVLEKTILVLMYVSTVLISCNYMNMRRIFPLCRSRHVALRIIGTVIMVIFSYIILLLILCIVEIIFSL